MVRSGSLIKFFLLIICSWCIPSKAQNELLSNLYSDSAQMQYAEFLEKKQRYNEAAGEYIKIYEKNKKETFINNILRNYLRSDSIAACAKFLSQHKFSDTSKIPNFRVFQFVTGLAETPTNKASTELDRNVWDCLQTAYLGDCKLAQTLAESILDTAKNLELEQKRTLQKIAEYKHRHLGKAVFWSAIIPGAGKIYAGRKYDFGNQLAVVLVNSVAAVLTYHKFGKNNVWPYIFSSTAGMFYLSGFHGAGKAVKEERLFQQMQIKNAIKNYLYNHFLTS